MANSRTSSSTSTGRFEEAIVDTDPGVDGYGCNPVNILYTRGLKKEEMRFYIRQIATGATITLRWKRMADTDWTEYEDFTEVVRKIIRDNSAGIEWDAIVKDNNQGSSGTSIFGIDW